MMTNKQPRDERISKVVSLSSYYVIARPCLVDSFFDICFSIGVFVSPASGADRVLVLYNVTNKICKRTDTAVAFTQEYFRVSYPLGNVSTLSRGSGRVIREDFLRFRIYV